MPSTLTEAVEWLVAHGGPTIRYRTQRELRQGAWVENRDELTEALLSSPAVTEWLGYLGFYGLKSNSSHGVHGGWNTSFETAMGKLIQLGLHAGMEPFDRLTTPWMEALARAGHDYSYHRMMVAVFLALAGYGDEEPVRSVLRSRLELIHGTLGSLGHSILLDPGVECEQVGLRLHPRALVDGEIGLPWIHDLYGFAVLLTSTWISQREAQQISDVIEWVLAPECQGVMHLRYGTIARSGKKWVGWRPDLPGYDGMNGEGVDLRALVLRLELFSRFPVARRHRWFRSGVQHLHRSQTSEGTFRFPAPYLTDANQRGYWVQGQRMGLGENRRRPLSLEVESTFWMALIKSNASWSWQNADHT